MLHKKIVFVGVVLLCCHVHTVDANSQNKFFKRLVMQMQSANTYMQEVCFDLLPGNYKISSSKPDIDVEFNVHQHKNNEVIYQVREITDQPLVKKFAITEFDHYCVMVTNQTSATTSFDLDIVLQHSKY